ncbi:hypothetical protein I4U23_005354 [Adineta vaga]|nr:hypothetical protein I4U23_005354 [Adineta vaga]
MYFVFNYLNICSPLHSASRLSEIDLNNPSNALPCPLLNVSAVCLITFDLFGALMLSDTFLQRNIATLLPLLSSTDVERLTYSWLDAYSFKLSTTIPEDSPIFNSSIAAWSNLEPRSGVTDVLSELSKKYQLGLLSNADSIYDAHGARRFGIYSDAIDSSAEDTNTQP